MTLENAVFLFCFFAFFLHSIQTQWSPPLRNNSQAQLVCAATIAHGHAADCAEPADHLGEHSYSAPEVGSPLCRLLG